MLVPEPEPPKHLQRTEVDAALVSLVRDAGEMARAQKLAKVIAHGLRSMDHEDLLQMTFTLLLTGCRKWPRGLPTLVLLKGVMRSVASNTRKKLDYVLAGDLGSPSDEYFNDEPSPLAEGVSSETDPANVVETQSELIAVQNVMKGDEDLEFFVEALSVGLTGMDIAKELDWDEKKYDATRKRFSRRLAPLKADRSSS